MNRWFKIGDKVNHKTLGEGIILDMFYINNQLVINVKFDNLKTERNIYSKNLEV